MTPAIFGASNLPKYGIPTVAGWNVTADVADYATGGRVMYLRGPLLSVDLAQAACASGLKFQNLASVEASPQAGSALATMRVAYGAPMPTVPEGDARAPHIAISPATVTVDVCAHPYFKSIAEHIRVIDRMILQGRIEFDAQYDKDGSEENKKTYFKDRYPSSATPNGKKAYELAALLNAGVRQYEVAGLGLSVTRFYKPETTPGISGDYAAVNKVFAWAQVKCGGMAVSEHVGTEPVAVLPDAEGSFNAVPLEWRCTGVSPAYRRGADTVVSWTFLGAEKWLGLFYQGGTGAYTL